MTGTTLFSTFCTHSTPNFSVAEELYDLRNTTCLYSKDVASDLYRGDIFSPRMPCQWYVRGGGEGKRRILIGQSVPPPLLEPQ
jgi:hypothetical protein